MFAQNRHYLKRMKAEIIQHGSHSEHGQRDSHGNSCNHVEDG